MKKIVLLTLALLILCFGSTYAAEKKALTLVFVNNAQTDYSGALGDKIMTNLKAELKGFDIQSGSKQLELLTQKGLTPATASNTDIAAAFADSGIDYFIYAELQPVTTRYYRSVFNQGYNAKATLILEIIYVKSGEYLYSDTIAADADDSESFWFTVSPQTASNIAVDQILKKTDDVLKLVK
jgi:hypothetical protein